MEREVRVMQQGVLTSWSEETKDVCLLGAMISGFLWSEAVKSHNGGFVCLKVRNVVML